MSYLLLRRFGMFVDYEGGCREVRIEFRKSRRLYVRINKEVRV